MLAPDDKKPQKTLKNCLLLAAIPSLFLIIYILFVFDGEKTEFFKFAVAATVFAITSVFMGRHAYGYYQINKEKRAW